MAVMKAHAGGATASVGFSACRQTTRVNTTRRVGFAGGSMTSKSRGRLNVEAAGLKELRDRIQSIKNSAKITSAMKLVAAARVRRAQEEVLVTRPYHDKITQLMFEFNDVLKNDDISNILTTVRPVNADCAVHSMRVSSKRQKIDTMSLPSKDLKLVCTWRAKREKISSPGTVTNTSLCDILQLHRDRRDMVQRLWQITSLHSSRVVPLTKLNLSSRNSCH